MYRLSPTCAVEIIDEVERVTATWCTVATRLELPSRELELMLAAFDTRTERRSMGSWRGIDLPPRSRRPVSVSPTYADPRRATAG